MSDDLDSKYSQPLPISEIWESDEWLGYAFGKAQTDSGALFDLGIVFKTAGYGKQVFEAIRGWNDNNDTDPDNNIGVSFIIEDGEEYLAYIYPTLEDRAPGELTAVAILCKAFPNPQTSLFRRFEKEYDGGDYVFSAYTMQGEVPVPIPGVQPILKSHLKIKRWDELSPGEVEHEHRKKVIGR